jgi:flagellin
MFFVIVTDRSTLMSSILTNPSALSALQALTQTQQALAQTQDQVSTGLAVANASENSSYWSIATQLNSDSGIVTAANSALTQSQSVLATASSAINSIITTISSIQTALTEATNPGADTNNINTSLASLSQQLTDAVNGASFNGLNILNGSQAAALNFVAGFNATASGGTVNTISFTAQALTGVTGGTTTTAQAPTITNATTIANLITNYGTSNGATLAVGTDVVTTTSATGNISVESEALDGTITTTTYQGVDSNGNNSTGLTAGAAAGDVAAFQVTVSTTPPAGTAGLLTQSSGGSSYNLTNLGNAPGGTQVSSANAQAMLNAVGGALSAVTNYAAIIGATQDRMTSYATFNTALTTNYAEGVSGLVDANMNTASTRLQALQTQEQLGIQSLSIANQNSQLILKLFNG